MAVTRGKVRDGWRVEDGFSRPGGDVVGTEEKEGEQGIKEMGLRGTRLRTDVSQDTS